MATTRALGTIFLLIGILASTVSLATSSWRNLHVQYGQGRPTDVQPLSDGIQLREHSNYKNSNVIRVVLSLAALGTGLALLAFCLEILRMFRHEGRAADRILMVEFVCTSIAAPSQLGSVTVFAYFFVAHASSAALQAEAEPRLSHLLNLMVIGANGWRAEPGFSFYLMVCSLICHAVAACVLCYELCHREERRRRRIELQQLHQQQLLQRRGSSNCKRVSLAPSPQLPPLPDLFVTEELPVPHCLVRRSRSSSINSQRSQNSQRSGSVSIVTAAACAGAAGSTVSCPHRRCNSVRTSPAVGGRAGRRASRASAGVGSGRSRESSVCCPGSGESAMLLLPQQYSHQHQQQHQYSINDNLLTVPHAYAAAVQFTEGGCGDSDTDNPEPVHL